MLDYFLLFMGLLLIIAMISSCLYLKATRKHAPDEDVEGIYNSSGRIPGDW
jgi:hypothetical protein